jgi:hypothetical protein
MIMAFLPQASGDAAITEKIIAALVALWPMMKAEYADLKPIFANAITALRSDPSATSANLDALDKFEAQLDSDYETAAVAAATEDAAAAKPAS